MRAAQAAHVMPSSGSSSRWVLTGVTRLVPRFVDRRAQRRVVEALAADGHELRVEIDGDELDAGMRRSGWTAVKWPRLSPATV